MHQYNNTLTPREHGESTEIYEQNIIPSTQNNGTLLVDM